MTEHTTKALPAERDAPSEHTETWGEFYARLTPEELSDWYDDSLDGFWKMRAEKQQKQETPEPNATASTAPIIEDGKTLDELVKGDTFGEYLMRTMRADGATDQEIWQFMLDN